jgi:hypothetical protein
MRHTLVDGSSLPRGTTAEARGLPPNRTAVLNSTQVRQARAPSSHS